MPRRSEYDIREERSMSQQLADMVKDYVDLAGSDPQISKKIQRLKVASKHGLLKGLLTDKELEIILDFLNGDRMAAFATNEKSSDVTKLGLQMPKSQKAYGIDEDERKKS